MHILEVLVYWMVSSYLFQNFSALCYMNFKTLLIPDELSYEFSHFLNRIVLFPAMMVMFLHYFLSLRTYKRKLLLILFFIFILGGLEWLGAPCLFQFGYCPQYAEYKTDSFPQIALFIRVHKYINIHLRVIKHEGSKYPQRF